MKTYQTGANGHGDSGNEGRVAVPLMRLRREGYMNQDQAVYAAAFRRMWPERNSERIHVFANGHEYNRAERRKSLRMNIGCQRRFRDASR